MVLLSAAVKRVDVSCMWDFFLMTRQNNFDSPVWLTFMFDKQKSRDTVITYSFINFYNFSFLKVGGGFAPLGHGHRKGTYTSSLLLLERIGLGNFF